ncbi:MAG TPA: hypothetical protein VLT90_03615 [Terriglobales bacterium]|nr:hypothetical protein [Terriglobales bacterium]
MSVALPAQTHTPKVITVAGGSLGSAKPATSAALAYPTALATDTKGNLYIADSINCLIRRVNRNGVISRFAGTGICGFSGDGGSAKGAMLSASTGIAFDTRGNLLIADPRNCRIRSISPAGIISTIAGNGVLGYSGDGGQATQASLAYPSDVSVDPSGNVYIAEPYNNVIRKIDTTGIIQTVAGNHSFGFSGDGGPATSAQLGSPYKVLPDNAGNFYIAEHANWRVRKVDASGIITTYAGNGMGFISGSGGPATTATIGSPNALLIRAGKLYIGTEANVWAVDQVSQIITIVTGDTTGAAGYYGDGYSAVAAALRFVGGLGSDAAGSLLIADSGNNRIRKIDTGQIITTAVGGYLGDEGSAKKASTGVYLAYQIGGQISFDSAGNYYYADTTYNRVRKVSTAGIIMTVAGTGLSGYSGDGGPALSASLWFPTSVAVDGSGDIFIADTGNKAIRKIDPTGTMTTISLGFSIEPQGLTCDIAGNLYATDRSNSVVWKITPSNSATIVAGVPHQSGYNGDGIPATQALLGTPTAVKLDRVGNLYIADWANNRIRKVDTSGIISTIAGIGISGFAGDGGPAISARLSFPTDIAVDAKGKVYIADMFNHRIRIVDPTGTINTYAGTGVSDYNGNSLAATATNVFPAAITTDAKGVVYFSDQGSFRIRKIH